MRKFIKFHWLVVKHASAASAGQIKRVMPLLGLPEAGMWLVSFCIFAVIAAFSYLWMGNLSKAEDFLNSFGLGIAGLISVYSLLFVVNLLLAPSKIFNEQEAKIEELNASVAKKVNSAEVIKNLSQALHKGRLIRDRKIADTEYSSWIAEEGVWRNQIKELAQKHFTDYHYAELGSVSFQSNARFTHAVNDEHNDELHFLDRRIEKWASFVKEYVDANGKS